MNRYVLIYDDSCPVCVASVEKLRQLDQLGLVSPQPLSAPAVSRNINLPPAAALKRQIHLISPDGTIYGGAEAVGRLAGLFPRSKLVGRLILLPFIRPLARLVYRLVARNRLKVARALGLRRPSS